MLDSIFWYIDVLIERQMTTTNEDADELRAGFNDDGGWGHLGWWGLGVTCEVDEVEE